MPIYEYECPKKHIYTEFLTVENYEQETKCPKCKKVGKRLISIAQREPSFSDKLYPYYDKGLNRIFNNKSERSSFLKKNGYFERNGGSMTPKQERMMYNMRLGKFNPKEARHVLKD